MTDLVWTPVKIRLGQIKPWSLNPRMSSKAQAQRLIKSERDLGQIQTLAVSPFNDGYVDLYDGHQRCSAWLTVKEPSFEVLALQSNRPLTEDERRKVSVTLHTATGSWDWNALSSWSAADLHEWGMDKDLLKEWNNETNNLKEMLNAEQAESVDAEPQTDRAAELLEKWQVKTGDLWQIGEHRLICGDCTDKAVVGRVMGENKIDLLFTSPPYNQGGESRNGDLATNRNGKVALYDEYKDDLSDEDYKELLFKFIEVAAPFVSDVHSVVVNISYNSNARDLYGKVLFSDRNPFTVRETIVWDKKSALNFPNSGIYSRRCEFIFVMSKSAKYLFSDWNGTRWNYYEVSKENQMKEHRAAFPLPLSERVLSEFSNSGSIVYEPFAGTGTTLVACQNLSRRGRAVEISPAYCAVTLQRMADAFPELEIKRLE